ncbi:Uncharacterized membrane protein [Solimonas aquatica]|uniref:Uncharacterized membrane protein n=1 Tax=Solimonas aquatica TaxID=489703 RepID=A0A1H9BQB9_9GAMM|nr:DUF2244 domain-containing protein [Solimonas aquatica]SEP91152.1 Uncharacterized membrane protein [Solimonas aquatica]
MRFSLRLFHAMLYNRKQGPKCVTPMVRDTQIVIGPNASLSVTQAWLFMGLTALVSMVIGIAMVSQGLWPVLPFAGLELLALGAGLYVSVRRNAYREVIRFGEETVYIEFGALGRGVLASASLPRYWVRAVLEAGGSAHAPTQLALVYAGQRVRIGRCLTDEERELLHQRLQDLLSSTRRMPGTPEQN